MRPGNRQQAPGNRKRIELFGLMLGAMLLALFTLAEAQQPAKVPRIGVLAATTPSFFSHRFAAFLQGLRELGYLDGKNILIEHRYAEGKRDRFPRLAAELVQLKVDVILTAGEFGVLAAKNATSTIPIVFAVTEDAVESGLVSSLARPGGNVTGLTVLAADLGGKRLELLKGAQRVRDQNCINFDTRGVASLIRPVNLGSS